MTQMELDRKEGTAVATAGQDPAAEPGSPATAGFANATTPVFKFAALGQELVIAGVFVGVYNQQPTFPVADPAAFCRGLVTFIHSRMKPEVYHHSFSPNQHSPTDRGGAAEGVHGSPTSKTLQQSDTAGTFVGESQEQQQNTGSGQHKEQLTHWQEEEQRSRQEVVQALQAVINILQAVPKLTALMASRPAITPLLNCLEPICRCSLHESTH